MMKKAGFAAALAALLLAPTAQAARHGWQLATSVADSNAPGFYTDAVIPSTTFLGTTDGMALAVKWTGPDTWVDGTLWCRGATDDEVLAYNFLWPAWPGMRELSLPGHRYCGGYFQAEGFRGGYVELELYRR
jgi:hypothetical protein